MAGNIDKYEQLSAYLDGELTEKERAEVDRMLAKDAEARAILNELRQTAMLVQDLPRERLSAAASAGLNARLERESLLGGTGAVAIRPRPWWHSVSIAAAILIVCGVTYESFVRLQAYRERRVFELADAEYAKTESPRDTQVALRASPSAGISPKAEVPPPAASVSGYGMQVASPPKEPMSLEGAARERDSDLPRGAASPAQNVASKDESHSAPVFGLLEGKEKQNDGKAESAEAQVVAAAVEKPASRVDSAVRTPMKAKLLATSRPSVTSQPTSRPAMSAVTSQPSTQRSDRE
jgi:hypothetical protein